LNAIPSVSVDVRPAAAIGRLAMLWLIGAALRLTILAVPPVLPLIHRDLAMSEKAVGLLSGLPVLLLGAVALPGSLVIARIGARRACLLGLVAVAAASAARGIGPSLALLFAMTLAMGAGVAVMQPALPVLVSQWFPRAPGLATAIYANGLLMGEAAPAALTIPVVLPWVGGSWALSFAVWAVPVAATALFLALATGEPARPGIAARWWPDWRNPQTWQLGLMQGGCGGLYFGANAFIPDYLHAVGRPELVAACLAALNLGQLPASLAIMLWAGRLGASRLAYLATPFVAFAAIAGFLVSSGWTMVAGAGVIGFCCAFVLILTLALPPQLAPTGDVHRLSAGMFAVGYSLSCLVPPLGGAVWDWSRIPATAFASGALGASFMLAGAVTLRPPQRPARGRAIAS
jgi:MFS transporter, CP family, cyanate transporter